MHRQSCVARTVQPAAAVVAIAGTASQPSLIPVPFWKCSKPPTVPRKRAYTLQTTEQRLYRPIPSRMAHDPRTGGQGSSLRYKLL
jgi:hypothetical protein